MDNINEMDEALKQITKNIENAQLSLKISIEFKDFLENKIIQVKEDEKLKEFHECEWDESCVMCKEYEHCMSELNSEKEKE